MGLATEIRELDENDPNLSGTSMVSNCKESTQILPAGTRSGEDVYCFVAARKTGLKDGVCTVKKGECPHLMYSSDIIIK